ncbi:hypothetical protein PKHYL_08730 [Psychrobacter sp. KH172YL61]|uniref:hypothetical protein n=1 Tax=Psychrobacter sp. KH172YL61 TaxID=2517899 RepID=UPI0010B55FE8|nr:hypothetical protein PKHYL_08730 [Psychrobacter sp. KH172YL61]
MFSSTKLTATKARSTETNTAIDNSSAADGQYSAAAQGQLAKLWAWIAAHPKSIAAIILLISMTLFMTLNVNGYWDFALPLRGKKTAGTDGGWLCDRRVDVIVSNVDSQSNSNALPTRI